ncbi:MAG: SH3 domain-containing protein, partial [Pseudomonadota bacterium]
MTPSTPKASGLQPTDIRDHTNRAKQTGRKPVRAAAICLIAAGLTACETTGSNQDLGTLIGGVTGAVIGSQIGGGTEERIAAGILGAAAGAWLGNEIGRRLDVRDQRRAQAAYQQAAVTGQNQTWTNPQTQTTGTAKVIGTQTKTTRQTVPVLKDKVEEVPPLRMIGTQHVAKSTVNVRGGPGTDYKVVNKLNPNEAVTVVGQVEGKNWYMISQGGVGSGFVSANLLTPVATGAAGSQIAEARPSGQ